MRINELAKNLKLMRARKVIENKITTILEAADADFTHRVLTERLNFEAASYDVDVSENCADVIVYVTYVDYDETAMTICETEGATKVTVNYTAFIKQGNLVHEVVTYCPHLDTKIEPTAFYAALTRFDEIRTELGVEEIPITVNAGMKMTVSYDHL